VCGQAGDTLAARVAADSSEDFDLSPEQSSSGITDVHSAPDAVSPFDNDAYSSW